MFPVIADHEAVDISPTQAASNGMLSVPSTLSRIACHIVDGSFTSSTSSRCRVSHLLQGLASEDVPTAAAAAGALCRLLAELGGRFLEVNAQIASQYLNMSDALIVLLLRSGVQGGSHNSARHALHPLHRNRAE